MKDIPTAQIILVGIAAIGGFFGGTCMAIRRMLHNGKARTALFMGYAFIGFTLEARHLSSSRKGVVGQDMELHRGRSCNKPVWRM